MPHAQISERASLTYRADIDGLRALAVVPVVLYHFHVAPFGGGFVGVDVFFVISGFLITALIHAEMQTGEYTLIGFYERRARRILPALFAMMLAASAAGLWFLFPDDLVRFGKSAAATSVFVSNFDFWQQSGYFDASAQTKPLLHTWSLAVEEQFYLLFPLLLVLFRKAGRRSLLLLTGGLVLASFAFSVWAVRSHPSLAFYLAPARIWELMLGATLALAGLPRPSRWLAEALSLLGLALLGIAVFGFSADTPIPGENALAPCLGAALLLYANAGGDTAAAQVLSWRPVVFIGLISYSLYLWHWPVFVFAHYLSLSPLGAFEIALAIALSILLAVVSWRFIEQPFRDRRRFSRRAVFTLAGLGMAAGLAIGGTLVATNGLLQRYPAKVQAILAEADDIDPMERRCGGVTLDRLEAGFVCRIGDPRATPSFALWGDSHAVALIAVVSHVARRAGRSGYFIGHVGCPPMLDLRTTSEPSPRCPRVNALGLALIAAHGIKTIFITGRWAFHDQGHGTQADSRGEERLIDTDGVGGDQHAVFARLLERTVAKVSGKGRRVILLADVPEIDYDVPTMLARLALTGAVLDIRPTLAAYRLRQAFVARDFAALKQRYGVTILEPASILCTTSRCAVADAGRPLYRDHHHLSVFGAEHLAPLFESVLMPEPPARRD